MPKTGPSDGSRRHNSAFAPMRARPSASPTEVVVLPSPAGVGDIAVTRISFPAGRCWMDRTKRSAIFALKRPYGSRNCSSIASRSCASSRSGRSFAAWAISMSVGTQAFGVGSAMVFLCGRRPGSAGRARLRFPCPPSSGERFAADQVFDRRVRLRQRIVAMLVADRQAFGKDELHVCDAEETEEGTNEPGLRIAGLAGVDTATGGEHDGEFAVQQALWTFF